MEVHSALFTAGPGQGLPPFSGTGLLHTLVLFCCPLPHRELHSDHCDHGDQPPFTAKRNLYIIYIIIIWYTTVKESIPAIRVRVSFPIIYMKSDRRCNIVYIYYSIRFNNHGIQGTCCTTRARDRSSQTHIHAYIYIYNNLLYI